MKPLIESMLVLAEGLSLGRQKVEENKPARPGLSPILRGQAKAKEETVLVDPGRSLEEAASSIKLSGEDAAMMVALALFLVKQDRSAITYASVFDKFTQHMPGVSSQVARTIARTATDYYTEMLADDQ